VSDTGGSLAIAKKHVESLEPSEMLVCTLHRKPWSTCDPDIFIEETDRWIIYGWEKVEAAEHIREGMGADGNYRESLRAAGFSEEDIELLELLGIESADPDSPSHQYRDGGYDDHE